MVTFMKKVTSFLRIFLGTLIVPLRSTKSLQTDGIRMTAFCLQQQEHQRMVRGVSFWEAESRQIKMCDFPWISEMPRVWYHASMSPFYYKLTTDTEGCVSVLSQVLEPSFLDTSFLSIIKITLHYAALFLFIQIKS